MYLNKCFPYRDDPTDWPQEAPDEPSLCIQPAAVEENTGGMSVCPITLAWQLCVLQKHCGGGAFGNADNRVGADPIIKWAKIHHG